MISRLTFLTIRLLFKALMLLAFTSCSKDNNNQLPEQLGNGNAIFENEIFHISYGSITDLGRYSNATTQNFILEFANGTNNGIYYSKETTTVISFDLNSEKLTELSEGKYVYNENKNRLPYTFNDAYAHFRLVYDNGNLLGGERHDEVTNGELQIQYNLNQAIIQYTLTFKGGDTLKGEYAGTLQQFVY